MERYLIYFLFFLLVSGCSTHTGHNYELSLTQSKEAFSHYKNGNYGEAVKQFEFLTSEVPKDANFWFYLGNSYFKNNQPQQAIIAYENAIIRDPKLSKGWYNLGLVHIRQAQQVFMDMQEYVPLNDPVKELSEKKLEKLLEL